MNTMTYTKQEDIKVIAGQVEELVNKVPGANYTMTVDKQWSNTEVNPHSVIYIIGLIDFWGEEGIEAKEMTSKLMLRGIVKDIAEEYQLEIIPHDLYDIYTLVQKH